MSDTLSEPKTALISHEKPFLSSIAQRRLPDIIAEQIVDGIRRNGLMPGDRLPTEQELARQLEVGRTSVREGLQRLQVLGIVEVRKGLGAFVSEPPRNDAKDAFVRWSAEHAFVIEELIEVRVALEGQAASLAAARADNAQIMEIERCDSEHQAGAELSEIVRSDERFHEAIFEASGSRMLATLYRELIAELLEFRWKTLALPWAPERSAKGHAEIVSAIRNRDPRAARSAMIDHLWVLYAEVHNAAEGRDPGVSAHLAPREAFG